MPDPKYSLPEMERRWLASLDDVGSLASAPFREIVDRYVLGTRLRLRRMEGPAGDVQFKFGKKYGRADGLSEPITNLYLTSEEYEALSRLEGPVVRKRRYLLHGGALDVYHADDLALFEVEFASEAQAAAYVPPSFVREEVTHNEAYSGAALAARGA